jgi:hypothetical protein
MSDNVIFGVENICKKYNIQKSTFRWLCERGAPIIKAKKGYFIHTESFDNFILSRTMEAQGTNAPEVPANETGTVRRRGSRRAAPEAKQTGGRVR